MKYLFRKGAGMISLIVLEKLLRIAISKDHFEAEKNKPAVWIVTYLKNATALSTGLFSKNPNNIAGIKILY
jgi:hypothetical protein